MSPPPRSRPWPRPSDRLAVGTSGLSISPICFGMTASEEAVSAAFDAGINFFFLSADLHWPRYEPLRRGLVDLLRRRPSMRDDIVVGVAAYVTQPEFCWVPFAEVIEAIPGLGHIDIHVAGGAYGHEWPARHEEYREQLGQRFLGVRALGASFHDRVAARHALNQGLVDVVFGRYNPYHTGMEIDVFPHLCPARRSLLYNFKSAAARLAPGRMEELGLGPEYWRPHATDYYRFALTAVDIDGLLVGLTDARQVHELVDALARGPLDHEERQYLVDLSALDAGAELERG